ncbi:unnamed protein product [Rotaria socialis]|uniref:Uncharacterized protein n=1 Tax=Rotaria socialis TaxID=392032 RepID=A0A820T7V0_9BILA|nr:unnamed protein product [Rotaria socialis]
MSTPGYDDPRKDRSGPAACQGSIVQIYYTRITTKEIPGPAQTMVAKSLAITHMAMLLSTSLVEGQCLGAKLPDTVNVAIQIGGTQVHEQYATKQNDFDEKKSTRIISKCSLNHRCHNT